MQPQGVPLSWRDVPVHVRDAVSAALGSSVVVATNEPGGLFPGVAARCRLADGRRVFVKSVSPTQSPLDPALYRQEAAIAAALATVVPAPRLLHVIDDGEWVALVFEEVRGRCPALPWSLHDLAATFAALKGLAAAATPCPVPGLPPVRERRGTSFDGFRRLLGSDAGTGELDGWTRRHLGRLATLEARWEQAAAGGSLVHADVRADNLLRTPDGAIMLVDSPHACVGAAWLDKLFLLPSVEVDSGPSPTDAAPQPFRGADPEAVDRVAVALAGSFAAQGALPDPPGLPTVRAFQRAQAGVAGRWLAERLGLR